MSNKQVREIEKDVKDLFYGDRELPQPYAVPVPIGEGIKTGKPRPPPDDQN